MVPLAVPSEPATSITMFGPGPSSWAGSWAKPAEAARTNAGISSLRIGSHLDRDHAVRVRGRLAPRDLVHMLHPRDHAAVNGVLAVQEVVVLEVDEELAVGA